MVTVTVSIKSDLQQLEGVARRVKDLRPALRNIGELVRNSVVENFEVGGRPTKWKPSQRAIKQRGKTLVDNAILMNSIAKARPQVTDDSVRVGTNVVYAAIHHFGGTIRRGPRSQTLAFNKTGRFMSRAAAGRRKTGSTRVAFAAIGGGETHMPARPFMMIQEQDKTDIRDTIVAYLMRNR